MTDVIQSLKAATGQAESMMSLFGVTSLRREAVDHHVGLAWEHPSPGTCELVPSGADGLGVGGQLSSASTEDSAPGSVPSSLGAAPLPPCQGEGCR